MFARILTVVDQFTRECVALEADRSITGMTVAHVLETSMEERASLPESITLNNGSEFCSRALEAWAMRNEVQLCIIRLDRPVENGFIESLDGRLRKECLNVEWSSSLDDARTKLSKFHEHYNGERPKSALADRMSAAFAAVTELFLDTLKETALARCQPSAAGQVQIKLSRLGKYANLLGMARLAFSAFKPGRSPHANVVS